MNVKELKLAIANFPDDMPIVLGLGIEYEDKNISALELDLYTDKDGYLDYNKVSYCNCVKFTNIYNGKYLCISPQ